MSAVTALLVSLAAAFIFTELCRHFKLPRVVGQIAAGIVLTIAFAASPELVEWKALLSTLADIGIILLFFFIGLEIHINVVKKNAYRSTLISIFNTLSPLIAGFLLMRFAGYSDAVALVVGVSLSVSAQALALDALDELGKTKTKIGQLIIAAGLVDDVLELGLITIVLTAVHITNVSPSIMQLVLEAIAVIAAFWILRKVIVPAVMKETENQHSPALILMGALVIALLMASFGELFSIGTVIGALGAGMLVRHFLVAENRKPWEEHALSKTLHDVSFGFFVPLFFVFIGMNTQLNVLIEQPLLVVALAAITFIGTIGGTALAIKLTKGTWKEGFAVGWALNAKGDTELAIATLALKNNFIPLEIFSAIVLIAVATTLVSPIMFRKMMENYSENTINTRG